MKVTGDIKTISGGDAEKAPDLQPVNPINTEHFASGVMSRVTPNTQDFQQALADPNVEILAYNVDPIKLNPTIGTYNPDPYNIHKTVLAAKKKVCPIVIPVSTTPGNGMPSHFQASENAWLTLANGTKIPRPNDYKFSDYMIQDLIANIAPKWKNDEAVACVRTCGYSVNTNEPSFVGNDDPDGDGVTVLKELQSQLSQAVAVPVGKPPITGYKFDSRGNVVFDGTVNDGYTVPHTSILQAWKDILGSKCMATLKFPDGGSEDGFRNALKLKLQQEKIIALNTGANENTHTDALSYAKQYLFGWGGITGLGKARPDLDGIQLRWQMAYQCFGWINDTTPVAPIRIWQATQSFFGPYAAVAAWIKAKLTR